MFQRLMSLSKKEKTNAGSQYGPPTNKLVGRRGLTGIKRPAHPS